MLNRARLIYKSGMQITISMGDMVPRGPDMDRAIQVITEDDPKEWGEQGKVWFYTRIIKALDPKSKIKHTIEKEVFDD